MVHELFSDAFVHVGQKLFDPPLSEHFIPF